VTVRRAMAEDLPDLLRLFRELDRMQRDRRVSTPRPGFYDEVARKYAEARRRPDVRDRRRRRGDGLRGDADPSRFSDERALELSSVVVRADHRRTGAGRALVREVARFAIERGLPWIELKTFSPNRDAMDFWESLGFTSRVVQLTSSTRALHERLAAD
jgi:GNAT superfamily N-acetyltransferase